MIPYKVSRVVGAGLMLAGMLSLGTGGLASASSGSSAPVSATCPNNPDPTFQGETPTFVHTDHNQIVSGVLTFTTVFRRGEQLFKTVFNECDGKGRPSATGNGIPTERNSVTGTFAMNRVSAPEAGNCAVCHNIPRNGGGGDFATTVFVLAQNLDPQSFLVDGTGGDERASPILFGAGGVELLAREISYDLRDQRVSCINSAVSTGQTVTTTLSSHGETFGTLKCFPQGGTTPQLLGGVIDSDLIVKPFHQKGAVRSLREFTVNPLNHHHGVQPVERFGFDRTYKTDFDADGVLTENEATIGDVDALVVYQAFLPVPGQVLPDDQAGQDSVNRGQNTFVSIGCTTCHVEELDTNGSSFLEPYDRNPPGNFSDQSHGFGYDLLANGASPRFEPTGTGGIKVKLYSDLKRHVICDNTYTKFCNEQVQMGTASLKAFMTAKLWGVGNSAPYGHRGDIATLAEAILSHGGDAVTQRNSYANLSESDRTDVINFLKSLQVLPNGATSLVMYQHEVDAMNRASDEVLIGGGLASNDKSGLAGVLARGIPLNGSPLVFLAGMVAYPLLRRRQVRYAVHTLVGTLVLSVVLSGVSLASAPISSARTPDGVNPQSLPSNLQSPTDLPVAALRVWGTNLAVPPDPVYNSLSTGLAPAQGKVPLTVTFNNLSVGGTRFSWNFGDGSPASTTTDMRQVSHTYTTPGVYAVTLTAQNASGTNTATYPNYVYADSTNPYFVDVTASSGVISNHSPAVANTMPMGQGAGWADYDNDGFEDLYVVQDGGRSWLWHNNGNSTFTNMATSAGVDNLGGVGHAMAWADYDNDGWKDLIVANFDKDGATGLLPRTKLFHNNHDGTFTDLAAATGLATDGWHRTNGFAWGDYDNDGLLDLYVSNHSNMNNFSTPTAINIQDQLYHQNPDHTFTNVTTQLLSPIVDTQGYGFAATWVDFDKDGDQDLYVVNDYFNGPTTDIVAKNILWKNLWVENGHVAGFQEMCAAPTGQQACLVLYGMGLSVADFNMDGWQDMTVSNIGDSHILRGASGLLFTDATYMPGVNIARGFFGTQHSVTWGEFAFDYDNNRTPDLLEVAGWLTLGHNETFAQPDALLSNNGRAQFTDVSALSGLDDPNRGRGGALSDYDNDGQVDWFVSNFTEADRLFHNQYRQVSGTNNNWLQIKLLGTRSNRDAMGARVEVTTGTGAGQRTAIQYVGANVGMGGTNSLILQFGLGPYTGTRTINIYWPSGRVSHYTSITANQRLTYTEP